MGSKKNKTNKNERSKNKKVSTSLESERSGCVDVELDLGESMISDLEGLMHSGGYISIGEVVRDILRKKMKEETDKEYPENAALGFYDTPVTGIDNPYIPELGTFLNAIPPEERWLWQNKGALDSVKEGLRQAAAGETVSFDELNCNETLNKVPTVGLFSKYTVTKTDGSPVDPNAKYFVLRLDKDPAAIEALLTYADQCDDLALAEDLLQTLEQYEIYSK